MKSLIRAEYRLKAHLSCNFRNWTRSNAKVKKRGKKLTSKAMRRYSRLLARGTVL